MESLKQLEKVLSLNVGVKKHLVRLKLKNEVDAMTRSHSRLFRFACKAIKYFLIGCFGISITGLITATFGISHVFVMLLPWLGSWLLRLGVAIGCLFATAVIAESLSS